jgi:serine/threonine protein kinase
MSEPNTSVDVVDQLAEEFACRLRAGERPGIEEYAERFPELADEIRAALPSVEMMEQLKPRRDQTVAANSTSNWSDTAPERVGEYRIIREIGRGGMGVVYEADQEALGRRVAIKVLPANLMSDQKLRSRFRREAQAAARLHHTNIVPVFAVGEEGGQCYYVMQLIEGQGLESIIERLKEEGGTAKEENGKTKGEGRRMELPLSLSDSSVSFHTSSFRSVARIGFQVADALAYAHAQGVVHRDIKPSNLLLDAGGTVWVTDFGVAKIAEGASLTQSGDIVGTMRYMPPERFAGHSDARGDVYSLGVTLYELLTQKPAFPDTTPHNLIQLITQHKLARPRKLNPSIPKDLETAVLKASARDPAHRYQTAKAFAEDLRRFLYDRPILAKRTGAAEQLWRWCRRNRALASLTAAALLLMAAITAVSLTAYAQTAAANKRIEKALAAEKTERDHAEKTASLALAALSRTYDRFAPNRLVVAPTASNELGVEIPIQPPTLPPEAIPLLEDLLRTYEQIVETSGEFPTLRPQVAEANHRIGDIRRRLGRFKEAAVAYQSAINLYTRLLPASSTDTLRIKLARAYNERGRTVRSLQHLDEASRMHQMAIQVLAEAPKALASRPECRYQLAYSYYSLEDRDFFAKKGPGKGPGPRLNNPTRRAVTLLEDLVRDYPDVPEYRHLLACYYRDAPPGWGPPREPEESPSSTEKSGPELAVDLLRKLVEDFPTIPDYRLDLCETLARWGGPRGRSGDANGKSEERMKQAIAISGELVNQYPNVPEYAAAHAQFLDKLGMDSYRASKFEDAEKLGRKAVTIQRRLVKQHPEVVAYNLWQCFMERSLGEALAARGQLAEARTLLEGATSRVEAYWRSDYRLVGLPRFLGMAYGNLARVLEQSGETPLAEEARRKAREFGKTK